MGRTQPRRMRTDLVGFEQADDRLADSSIGHRAGVCAQRILVGHLHRLRFDGDCVYTGGPKWPGL